MKLAALTIGPTGVGLIGLYQNVVGMASSLGGLGIASAAPREVAVARAARGSEGEAAVGLMVMVASAALAILSGLIFFVAREPIAEFALGDSSLAGDVGWLSIGVGASVMVAAQTSLLTAFGRIGDAGRAIFYSSLLMTIVAAGIFFLAAPKAPMLFVLSTLVIGCFVATYYAARLPRPTLRRLETASLVPLSRLGIALSASAMLSLVSLLIVRRVVDEHLGSAGLGHFHASWALAAVYLALILQAMSADFYPRLSETISDGEAFNRLINDQSEIAILVGGPIILGSIGAAPIIMIIFYGGAFAESAAMFSWLLAGDVLRIVSWPLSFALLARNERLSYFTCEATAWTTFALVSALLVPKTGLSGTGVAYCTMYLVYLPVTWFVLKRHAPVRWNRRVTLDFLALLAAALLLLGLRAYNHDVALGAGILAAAIFAFLAFRRLRPLYSRSHGI